MFMLLLPAPSPPRRASSCGTICCANNLVAVGTSSGPDSDRVLLCLFLPLYFCAIAMPRGAELPNPTTRPRFFVTWSDGSIRCDREGDALAVACNNVCAADRDGEAELRGRWVTTVFTLTIELLLFRLLAACMLSNETVFRTSGAGDDLLLPDVE